MAADFTFIVNPISSSGKALRLAEAVADRIRAVGTTATVKMTRAAGDARRLAAEVEHGVVVACGGDGTFNEVVVGKRGPEVPVAIVPAGLGNVVAKEFGLPRDPGGISRMLLAGRSVQVDAGRVACDGGVPRSFSFLFSVGFDALTVQRLHQARTGALTKVGYLRAGLGAVAAADGTAVDVHIDGKPWLSAARYVAVANLASYGGPLRVMRKALFDDGRLDVVAIPGALGPRMLKLMWNGWLRGFEAMPDARRASAARATLRCAVKTCAQVDGDVLEGQSFEVEVVAGAIRLLVP
jgi:diacylglycerol kinase (ATP)